MTALAFLAAVAAMLANGAASLMEALGSRRAAGGRPTWRRPRYLAGVGVDGLGWLLSVTALRVLPVVAVQSVLAGTVPVTLLAERGWSPRRLSRSERAAAAMVLVGLVLVAAGAAPGRAGRLPGTAQPVLIAAALVVLAVLALGSAGTVLLAGNAPGRGRHRGGGCCR